MHLLDPAVPTSSPGWQWFCYSEISFLATTRYTNSACRNMGRKCLLLPRVLVTQLQSKESLDSVPAFILLLTKKSISSSQCLFFIYRLGRYFRIDLLLLLILLLLKWWPYLFLLKTAYHITQAVTPALCLPLISVKNATSVKCANCFFLLLCFLLSDFSWVSSGEVYRNRKRLMIYPKWVTNEVRSCASELLFQVQSSAVFIFT